MINIFNKKELVLHIRHNKEEQIFQNTMLMYLDLLKILLLIFQDKKLIFSKIKQQLFEKTKLNILLTI
jgi:hypothetical protein